MTRDQRVIFYKSAYLSEKFKNEGGLLTVKNGTFLQVKKHAEIFR